MSILDKAIAAITPPESDAARAKARAKAQAAARPGDWLSQILDHHRGIEAQFAVVKAATDAASRRSEQKKLGILLTGHSIAEEAAIYPALAADKQVGHAELAYQEQSAAKMEMGLLERLDPMSQDYLDKLGHIEARLPTISIPRKALGSPNWPSLRVRTTRRASPSAMLRNMPATWAPTPRAIRPVAAGRPAPTGAAILS